MAQRRARRVPASHPVALQLAKSRGRRADPRGRRGCWRTGRTGARHCRNATGARTCGYADLAFRPSGHLVRLHAHVVAGGPRRIAAAAKTAVWLGRVPQAAVKSLLAQRPEWWRNFVTAIIYGDVAATVAADLLIRDSERRCAAVLLRLGGRRFPGPEDKAPVEVPVTQMNLPTPPICHAIRSARCCSGWRRGDSSRSVIAA